MSPIAIYRPQPPAIQAARRILVRKQNFWTERSLAMKASDQTFTPSPSGPDAGIHPGNHVWAWCKEHDITLPDRMKSLKVRLDSNRFKLSVYSSRQHCIDITSMRYFDRHEHPFARTMFDIYVAKKKAPLWYKAWAGASALPFCTREAERRIRHAVRDALNRRGYDRDGRKTAAAEPGGGGAGGRSGRDNDVADLFGTLKIQTFEPKLICNVKFAELVGPIDMIIGMVELELRRDRYGRHTGTSSQAPKARPQSRHQGGGQNRRPNTSSW